MPERSENFESSIPETLTMTVVAKAIVNDRGKQPCRICEPCSSNRNLFLDSDSRILGLQSREDVKLLEGLTCLQASSKRRLR